MINKSDIIVVIIIHKSDPTNSEIASLIQCHKILKNYRIDLICPLGLDVEQYKKHVSRLNINEIDPKWQSSYRKFNRLKIEPFLYKKYANFKFMLFYELDAWVFQDKLLEWCEKDYDFIGAPWVKDFSDKKKFDGFWEVGNGGFSLRKISSHLKALHLFSFIEKPRSILSEILNRKLIASKFRGLLYFPVRLIIGNNTHHLLNKYPDNEDVFWTQVVGKNFSWFKVAPIDDAVNFSFEMYPEECYKLNKEELPFGCHAWEKYNKDFWKNFINPQDVDKETMSIDFSVEI
mgnify:CR=1 FL=1